MGLDSGGVVGALQPAPVEPEDLLVGLLLAHPDKDGEAWALLDHFGLTAPRPPSNYPTINVDDLAVRASTLDLDAIELSEVTGSLLAPRSSVMHIAEVLGALLAAPSALTSSMEAALRSRGVALSALSSSYQEFLATDPSHQRDPAGRLLRHWLDEYLPLVPVDLPTYSSDRIEENTDLSGTDRSRRLRQPDRRPRSTTAPRHRPVRRLGQRQELPHGQDPASGEDLTGPRGQGAAAAGLAECRGDRVQRVAVRAERPLGSPGTTSSRS